MHFFVYSCSRRELCDALRLLGIGALMALPVGCLNPIGDTPKLRILAILDSTTPNRLPGARQRISVALSRRRKLARAAIYRLDQDCVEIHSPDQKIPEQEDLLEALIQKTDSSPSRGTFPHVAWETLARVAEGCPLPTVVLWEGNGDQDDQSESAASRMSVAIKKLAQHSEVKLVLMVGIDPVNRGRVRRELAPFKNRVRLLDERIDADEVVKNIDLCLPSEGDAPSRMGGTR